MKRKIFYYLSLALIMTSCGKDEFVFEEVSLTIEIKAARENNIPLVFPTDSIDELLVLQLVNQIRTQGYVLDSDTNKYITSSLNKLKWDNKLKLASQIHCTFLYQTNDYGDGHMWPDGTNVEKRMHWANCYYSPGAENTLKGNRNELTAVKAWLNSPKHREAMLEGVFNRIAVSKKGIYWTMVLGYELPDGLK